MSGEEGLFPELEPTLLNEGDRVLVQFSWGDERAEILGKRKIDGFPVLDILTDGGSKCSILASRAKLDVAS